MASKALSKAKQHLKDAYQWYSDLTPLQKDWVILAVGFIAGAILL